MKRRINRIKKQWRACREWFAAGKWLAQAAVVCVVALLGFCKAHFGGRYE